MDFVKLIEKEAKHRGELVEIVTEQGTLAIIVYDCETGGLIHGFIRDNDMDPEYLAALDALESLILAHACSGINVKSLAYIGGVNEALKAVEENFG